MAEAFNTLGEDGRTKFEYFASKFTSLVHGRSEGDRQQINSLLDELNSLDFKLPVVNNTDKAVLIINQCCSTVPPNDTFLVAKGCQLISNLIAKQHVKVEGKTLSLAVSWCAQSLRYCGDIAILDILLALEALLRGNGRNVEEQIHELLGTNGVLTLLLLHGCETNRKRDGLILASPWEVQLMTIKCFESLTFAPDNKGESPTSEGPKLPHLELCSQIFLKQLYAEKREDQDELLYAKVVTASLRGLQNITQQSPDLRNKLIGEMLGMVKTYMLYGLHGYTNLRPQQVFPTNLNQCDVRQPTVREGRGGKSARTRKRNVQRQKKSDAGTNRNVDDGERAPLQSFSSYTFVDSTKNIVAPESNLGTSLYPGWLKTSDSDFSDAEAGQAAKVRLCQGRVRQASLSLLLTVTKVCERKILFGYWSSLIPDGPNMLHVPTLCTCLLRDPSSRNRIVVLQILTVMLIGSRLYLSQAEKSSRSSVSFTPFSVTVGNMVQELHCLLCLALAMENSIPVITQLLKCVAALVQNTPYHRLEPGLVTKLVEHIRSYLRHKDASVQVASLTVLGSIVAAEPGTPKITDILCKCSVAASRGQQVCDTRSESAVEIPNEDGDYDDEIEDEIDALLESTSEVANKEQSWLLEVCLNNVRQPATNEGMRLPVRADSGTGFCSTPVRVESLQVLAVLARNYFMQVVSSRLGAVMQVLVQALSDEATTICLHSGRVIDVLGNSMQQCLQEEGEKNCCSGGMKAVSLDKNLQFWQTVLSRPLISLVQNAEEPNLRAVGCDCLASIGREVFEQLPHERQTLIIKLLFRCSRDEEINVRSSAVRALAMCVLFPSLREDLHFIVDTAESVIQSVQDESSLVRMKASWSLGNLSDALVLNSMADNIADIPIELLLKLMQTGIKAAYDNDKVRSNAVRAVGNFLQLVTGDLMAKGNFKDCTDKAITALVHNATTGSNMKVRWNACYAIGNMMKNSALYSEGSSWQNTVFSALTTLVKDVRNFKVRINAALALSVPSSRHQYSSHYINIWTALIEGLDNSQNMDDFSEYKHRDNLLDQICLTLSHLASVATKEDLGPLHDVLVFHLDTLQQHFLKFHERVVPEKSGAVTAASSHATSLLQLASLSSNQHSAAALLTSVFLQDTDLALRFN